VSPRILAGVLVVLACAGCASNAARRSNCFRLRTAVAVEILRHAERVESNSLGPAGVPSCLAAAYRHIKQQRNAGALFLDLARNATPAGRAYALAGLYATRRADFDMLAAEFARDAQPIETVDTCLVSRDTPAAILWRIRNGDFWVE